MLKTCANPIRGDTADNLGNPFSAEVQGIKAGRGRPLRQSVSGGPHYRGLLGSSMDNRTEDSGLGPFFAALK